MSKPDGQAKLSIEMSQKLGLAMLNAKMAPTAQIHCACLTLANACAMTIICSKHTGDTKDVAFVEELISILANQMREDIIRKVEALNGF